MQNSPGPKQKPSWNGKRFRFLLKPPKRADLWEEYVDLKRIDWQQATQAAHEFYVANREAMDDGAEVACTEAACDGDGDGDACPCAADQGFSCMQLGSGPRCAPGVRATPARKPPSPGARRRCN